MLKSQYTNAQCLELNKIHEIRLARKYKFCAEIKSPISFFIVRIKEKTKRKCASYCLSYSTPNGKKGSDCNPIDKWLATNNPALGFWNFRIDNLKLAKPCPDLLSLELETR